MTSIRDRNYLCRERLFKALLDSSPSLESDGKLFNQLAGPLGPYLAVIPTTIPPISKYTKEDLQQIFKTVLEA